MSDELARADEARDNQGGVLFAPQQSGNALAAIASNAEVTTVMASIYVAKQFPRNLAMATAEMNQNCGRLNLAKKATYSYARGGSAIEGPSIRLAEVLMGAWGNMEAGWREISRHFDAKSGKMVSECSAFAFDKQSNTRTEIAFSVPHWRDTKRGGYAITDERDIYELCANMAARRKRAAILSILPSWFVEEALEEVNKTLKKDMAGKSIPDMVRGMEAKFVVYGVTREMLEKNLGHPIEECTRDELVRLGKNYTAISDGAIRVSDIFPQEEEKPVVAAAATVKKDATVDAQPVVTERKKGAVKVAKGSLFDEDPEDDIPM